MIEALGVRPTYVGQNRFDYLIEVADADQVRNLAPNMTLLQTVVCRGVMVTSQADMPEYDFISRFFAPAFGIPEDPVTGSAHCCLGPYWAEKLGRQELRAFQASPRGGEVQVRLGDNRVFLGGQAVTVLEGKLL